MAVTLLNPTKKIFVVVFAAVAAFAAAICAAKAEDAPGKMVTFTSPKEKYSYSLAGYRVSNNAWGAGKLVEDVDYSTSVTFDPNNFQAGTSFSWKFPRSVGGVYAYPHIDYAVSAAGVSSTKADDIDNLSAAFGVDLSNKASSTVAFDLWFNGKPNGAWETTSAELLIEVHPTARAKPNQSFVLTGSGFKDATVYVSNMKAAGASWKFIDVKLPVDMMSGTLSLSDIIKGLIANGVLTGQEYLASLQFGSEVRGGTGSLQISRLSYDWTTKPPAAGTPKE